MSSVECRVSSIEYRVSSIEPNSGIIRYQINNFIYQVIDPALVIHCIMCCRRRDVDTDFPKCSKDFGMLLSTEATTALHPQARTNHHRGNHRCCYSALSDSFLQPTTVDFVIILVLLTPCL